MTRSLDGMCSSLLDAAAGSATLKTRGLAMRHQQLSWVWATALGLASLHCGTPDTAGQHGEPTLPADPAPGDADGVEPGGEVVAPEGGTGDLESALPVDGGQTGDDNGSEGLDCDVVTESRLALDEVSSLGFAPNDLLSFAAGSHTFPLRWFEPVFGADGGLLDYATAATSDVQVDVEIVGTDARRIDRFDSKYGVSCPSFVEVDARLTLTSSDGKLTEQVVAPLLLDKLGMLGLTASIPAAAIQGSFTFAPPELDGQYPSALTIHLGFSRFGQSGQVTQVYGQGGPSQLTGAEWPIWGSCGFWGTFPATYESAGPPSADVLELVSGATPFTVTNARGESGALQLQLTPQSQSTCFTPAQQPEQPGTWYAYDLLAIPMQLSLSSPVLPGPLQLPVEVIGQLVPGTMDVAKAFFSTVMQPCGTNSYYTPQDFVSHCGDWGVDLSGVESVFLEVNVSELTSEHGYAIFSVRGKKMPGCTPSPEGFHCPGEGPQGNVEAVTLGEVRLLRE
jgi:hypothetical protein